MNVAVRQFLVDLAHAPYDKTISYQELADTCDLGLNMAEFPHHRQEMGVILGDISAYEYAHGRPLLSALVILKKPDGSIEHGKGFYRLCEILKIGAASKLERDLFGIEQMRESYNYWRNSEHYRLHR